MPFNGFAILQKVDGKQRAKGEGTIPKKNYRKNDEGNGSEQGHHLSHIKTHSKFCFILHCP